MKAKDFKKQIDALNLCYYLVNHLDGKEKKDRIFDLGEIIYKEIIQLFPVSSFSLFLSPLFFH